MKRAFFVLFITLMVSSPAVSDTFTLAPVFSPDFANTGMITWISPVNGTIQISGNAWTTYHTSDVTIEWIPASLAPLINNPGNGPGGALQAGTYAVDAGTVQAGLDPSSVYYESPSDPADFGTSASIPCENSDMVSSECGGYTAPIPAIPVSEGDMIAAVIENYYMYSGDTVGLNLNVQMVGNAQGSGGTLASPQVLTSTTYGIDGTLDPSSSDVYEFYWGGGDFQSTATTDGDSVGIGPVAGGFANGMGLSLYSFPAGSLIGSATVLVGSTSGSFDFGSLPAGDYELQVTDLAPSGDPPYDIEFNGPVGAPPPSGSTPEPSSILLLCTVLAALALGGRQIGQFGR
jgi:hypothetical protein